MTSIYEKELNPFLGNTELFDREFGMEPLYEFEDELQHLEEFENDNLFSEYEEGGVYFDGEGESGWSSEINRRSPDYIRWVQSSLNKILGLRLAVDGILGPQTRSAVRSFQQQNGLKIDGIVGPQTENALNAYNTQLSGNTFTAGAVSFSHADNSIASKPTLNPCSVYPFVAPTPYEEKKIEPAGAEENGCWEDARNRFHEPKPFISVMLTHYDKNDWMCSRKSKHREAIYKVTEGIKSYLKNNPESRLKVTISGHCSKTGSKEYNNILSMKRANAVARTICIGLSQWKNYINRIFFNVSGRGFAEAKCGAKGPSKCEDPYYRSVLIAVHDPSKPLPIIPPDPMPIGWSKYKIRNCSFKSETLVTALLDDLRTQILPLDVKRILEKIFRENPFLDSLKNSFLKKVLDWIAEKLPTQVLRILKNVGKFEALINKISKYIIIELIRVNALFEFVERDRNLNQAKSILGYIGYGFRVKIPDIPNRELEKILGDIQTIPKPIRDALVDSLKKIFKASIGMNHLESKCSGPFRNFELVRLTGSQNKPIPAPKHISIFQGGVAVGTAIEGNKIVIAFNTPQFRLNGIRIGRCSECSRNSITLPLGQPVGIELFLASEGELKRSVQNCRECLAPSRMTNLTRPHYL